MDWPLEHIRLPDRSDEFPICRVDVDGEAWDVVTNGHGLAARRVTAESPPISAPELPLLPPTERRREALAKMLRRPSGATSVRLDALRAIAGDPSPCVQEECSACFGSGWDADRDGGCECSNCQCCECGGPPGTVESGVTIRYAHVGGVFCNANLLACALASLGPLDDQIVRIAFVPAECLIIADGDDWRVVVTGMTTTHCDRETVDSAPRHFEQVPA